MNCVGIDVSKGKSMIAVMRPFGEVVVSPFEVRHTASELSKLAGLLKSLDGETRVVMESTGNYHAPVAWLLHDAGLYVSVVNAMLVHDYGNNSLRRGKTDKKDAVKLANYGLDHWLTLPRYVPEEDTRLMLKTCYRQYQQYSKVQTMLKNNLISLLDTTFPDANRLFTSPPRTPPHCHPASACRPSAAALLFRFFPVKNMQPVIGGADTRPTHAHLCRVRRMYPCGSLRRDRRRFPLSRTLCASHALLQCDGLPDSYTAHTPRTAPSCVLLACPAQSTPILAR